MADVFISYSREDETFVDRLEAALEARGRTAWVDRSKIRPTAEWMAEIRTAIEAADDFLFVMSPASLESEICGRELEIAETMGKRLVPVLWRGTGCDAAPASLASLQWVDFRASADLESAMGALTEALDTDIEWVRAHTRLLGRAGEWRTKNRDSSFLLRGSDLEHAKSWLDGHAGQEPAPIELQREYVAASQRGRTRRRRILLGAVAVVLAGAAVLASWAWRERRQGGREATINSALRLVEVSNEVRENRGEKPEHAVWLALEAARRLESVDALSHEADRALREGLGLLAIRGPRLGHEATVAHMAYDDGGETLATITVRGRARLWRLPEGELERELGSVRRVDAIALAGEQRLLGAAIVSDSACVWELVTDRRLFCRRHDDEVFPPGTTAPDPTLVTAVALTPDGTHLVTGGLATVRIWSLPDGIELARFEAGFYPDRLAVAYEGARAAAISLARTSVFDRSRQDIVLRLPESVEVLALAPNGVRLAVADGSELAVWDVRGRVHRPLGRLPAQIEAMAFGRTGGALATAVADGTVRVWNAITAEEMARLPQGGRVTSLLFGSFNEMAVAGDFPYVQIWRPGGGTAARRIRHGGSLRQAVFSPDGKILATSGSRPAVRLWNPEERGAPRELEHETAVNHLAFSADGALLAAADMDSIHLWRLPDGEPVDELDFGRPPVGGIALAPDARRLAAHGSDDYLYVWTLDGSEKVRLKHPDWLSKAVFSTDGSRFATAAAGVVTVARTEDREILLRGKSSADIVDLAIASAGELVATAHNDGYGRIWQVPEVRSDGEPVPIEVASFPEGADPETRSAALKTVVLSPDGVLVATAGDDRRLRLWSTLEGSPVAALEHFGGVLGVAFSPDGSHLATVAADRVLRVWRVGTWRELVRAPHGAEPLTVSFQPGGRHLVTATRDGLAWLWLWRSADLRAEACSRLTTELTGEECRRLVGRGSCRDICG